MCRAARHVLSAGLVAVLVVSTAMAAPPPRGPRGPNGPSEGKEDKPKYKPLPNDERLIALHKDFVRKAEILAKEYERTKQLDKALDVYGEIIKLVPQYEAARAARENILQLQATAEKVLLDVQASGDWQPTGVTLLAGKPVTIEAAGAWTFRLERKLGPDGMTIPKELCEFNLGSLIGVVDTGNPKEIKPFVIGEGVQFVAEQSGPLLLRMYDVDPRDNEGALKVQIRGTFIVQNRAKP